MPELPEVEAARHTIKSSALHQKVDQVEVREDRVLDGSAQKLWSNVTGHAFQSAERHGKYVLVQLDNDKWLVFHLGMTGDIYYLKDEDEEPEHSRILLHFDNSARLAFDNQRMLGEVAVVDDKDAFIRDKDLGPDALSLDYEAFRERLAGRRGMIKTALMDQQLMAGIGNVFSDEILFQARLHPRSQIQQLNEDHIRAVYDQMQSVLKTSVEIRIKGESLLDSFLIPHRSEGESCPNCGGKVQQVSIGGRNAYCCPHCQEEVT